MKAESLAEAVFAAAAAQPSVAPFVSVPIDDLNTRPPSPPAFIWDAYLPAGVVTLLGAHGGTGKTILSLMLSICGALGRPLFGVPVRRVNVAFFSGEDGADILRHRLHWICKAMAVDPAELAGRLHVLDATADPVLFHEISADGRRIGTTTPGFADLSAFVAEHEVGLLIVDNASDAFDASEIERARVRGFMRSLAALARQMDGAVLLLAHVDKGTSRGDRAGSESYSGSTAWHNSARSRLYLSRDKDGSLTLEHQKSNLGPASEPLKLIWPEHGLPTVDRPLTGIVQSIERRTQTQALLRLIHEFNERGEWVSTATTSRTHAGKLLRGQPGFPARLKDPELFDLLRLAERQGLLARREFKGADRKPRECWDVTPEGRAAASLAATAATSRDYGSGAVAQWPREPAATAATSPPGGVGERARARSGAPAASAAPWEGGRE